jgi:hypothetical protein
MRIKLIELRRLVRTVLKEVGDKPTISADLDPGEKELKAQYPKWGKGSSVKQTSPAQVKAKQVATILSKKGLTGDPTNQKKITQGLLQFIEKMDPTDVFTADPDDIATAFAQQVLGTQRD